MSQLEDAKELSKNRESELSKKLKEANETIDDLSIELDQIKLSKNALMKKYEQKVFEENEALYRKLRRAENDLRIADQTLRSIFVFNICKLYSVRSPFRILTTQIDQLKAEYATQGLAKQSLEDELNLSYEKQQETRNEADKIKSEYDQLIISKDESGKNSDQIEYLQQELDKARIEVYCIHYF